MNKSIYIYIQVSILSTSIRFLFPHITSTNLEVFDTISGLKDIHAGVVQAVYHLCCYFTYLLKIFIQQSFSYEFNELYINETLFVPLVEPLLENFILAW